MKTDMLVNAEVDVQQGDSIFSFETRLMYCVTDIISENVVELTPLVEGTNTLLIIKQDLMPFNRKFSYVGKLFHT